MPICGIRMTAQHFIEGFIAIITGRTVIALLVVLSRLLIKLNVNLIDKLLLSYKGALANTFKDQI